MFFFTMLMKPCTLLLAVALMTTACSRFGSKSAISEEPLEMLTYPFSDPDPVPHPESQLYPYFRFNGYSHNGELQSWNTVVLENDYVKVTVIPAIGGKIWTAVEKKNGEDFLYHNHVVKFRNISMRGPWTSGGVELNFGLLGHQPTVSTPVDYYTRTNEDGSVSCFVGALDLLTRTRWQVEINLEPDKAFFTTRPLWHNTTALSQPYYQWMNAAYRAAADLSFHLPGQYYIGHDGDAHPWPVDEQGRDLSKYANNNFGGDKSYHVLGNYNGFYAAYYTDKHIGSVHYSPFGEKPGMKIWIWSMSRQGGIWEDLLTDADGQYVELQSGRLFNQADGQSYQTPFKQFAFAPSATDSWTEYWFPVKDIGGVSKANEYGALHLSKTAEGGLLVSIAAAQKIDDELSVTFNGDEVYRNHLKLNPLETWSETVPCSFSGIVQLRLGEGKLEYSTAPDGYRLSRPVEAPKDFDWNSARGLYLKGEQAMYFHRHMEADSLLRRSLLLEPYSLPTLRNLTMLCLGWGRYQEAFTLSHIMLSVNAYDPDANLLYGLSTAALGRSHDAIDGFTMAAHSLSHRVAAYTCLSKEALKNNKWRQALGFADDALCYDALNEEAMLLKAISLRKTGNDKEAAAVTAEMERLFPLYHHLRFENWQRSCSEADKKLFLQYLRSELPNESLMEIADFYESCGCTAEAASLYDLAHDYPMACYRKAFLLKGQEASELLNKADSLPLPLIYPHRATDVAALQWAVQQTDSWKSKFYMAMLLASQDAKAKATALLDECGNKPNEAAFYLARAAFRKGAQKLADIETAEQYGESWRSAVARLDFYRGEKQFAKMLEFSDKYSTKYSSNEVIALRRAEAFCRLGRYDDCLDVLDKLSVLPNEGAAGGHPLYHEALMQLAMRSFRQRDYGKALEQVEKARLWPENLGAGKPYNEEIDSRAEDLLTARCYERLQNREMAASYHEKVKKSLFKEINKLLNTVRSL